MSEELERQRKANGKKVVDAIKDMKINKAVSEEETGESLKPMKHIEYSVIEQLKKTSARISLVSLFMSFEPYCKTL